ncbi:regulator of protease activity HflC (stomatin/prohibitin superfamily) [Marmoricola sp. OAE513]|uniref:SPFH domain-containing protein n=1 Tax=Marmoricola sp. OAE513 TaxID=2817894 RepID=UPI001AE51B11
MPGILILALIAVIGAVLVLPVSWTDSKGTKRTLRAASAGLVVLALLCVGLASFTVVGTRNAGVVTTFGKPSGRTLGNGLHLKAPWQKVTDIDGTITTQKFTGEGDCISVRIGDGSTACVSVVIRSRINQDAADDIYADYRNSDKDINENVNDALVRTQLTSALASVFSTFNPLLNTGTQPVSNTAPDLQKFSTEVSTKMDGLLRAVSDDDKPQVDIKSITISYIRLSEGTQQKINQLQLEVAATRVAEQKKITNQRLAEANKALADSLSKDPNVLVSKCLDLIDDGRQLPAGFSCWPGSGSSVVIPSAR